MKLIPLIQTHLSIHGQSLQIGLEEVISQSILPFIPNEVSLGTFFCSIKKIEPITVAVLSTNKQEPTILTCSNTHFHYSSAASMLTHSELEQSQSEGFIQCALLMNLGEAIRCTYEQAVKSGFPLTYPPAISNYRRFDESIPRHQFQKVLEINEKMRRIRL